MVDREYMLECVDALIVAKDRAEGIREEFESSLASAENGFILYEDAKNQFDQLWDEWFDLPEFRAELERRGVRWLDGVEFPEPNQIVKESGFWG